MSRRRVAFIFGDANGHRCAPSKSNTWVRDSDSQKYEGGRVVAVSSFDRCVSVPRNRVD